MLASIDYCERTRSPSEEQTIVGTCYSPVIIRATELPLYYAGQALAAKLIIAVMLVATCSYLFVREILL